ncbi:MAG: hypothetical protein OSJ63_07840 [Bacilli bacterium]|nr:hypothetical protein [Bacilli bacterium]
MKKKIIKYLTTALILTGCAVSADTHISSAGSAYQNTEYDIQKIMEETALFDEHEIHRFIEETKYAFDGNETAIKVNDDGSITIYTTNGSTNKNYHVGNNLYMYPIAMTYGVTE